MEHLDPRIRVPIDEDNQSVVRDETKCIKCGNCTKVCCEYLSVLDHYDISKTKHAVCMGCGQCAQMCPMDSITERPEYEMVKKAIGSGKVVVISTSPSCRVSLGEEFGLSDGSFVEGQMVALLRKLGFKYVLDTNFSADLTIMEEVTELLDRIKNKTKPLPQFTSCCPAWIKFAETFYPDIRDNISSCKSPIGMQGALIKTYFASIIGIDPKSIVSVALTPCTAKKMEIRRESGINDSDNGELRDMDYCLTVTELAKWAKEENIDFNSLNNSKFDKFMGEASGAGVIFGNSGGVMEASVRTAYKMLTHKDCPENLYNLQAVRGNEGIREASIDIDGLVLKVAVVFGLKNARMILDRVNSGEHFDYIEIMSCPGGCIGGGGQPKKDIKEIRPNEMRMAGLYNRDKEMEIRCSCDNEEVLRLYDELLGMPNSKTAKEMLHTKYFDRSGDLCLDQNPKKVSATKCLICGEIFEVEENSKPVCPKCKERGDELIKLDE